VRLPNQPEDKGRFPEKREENTLNTYSQISLPFSLSLRDEDSDLDFTCNYPLRLKKVKSLPTVK
jgi:hypothetical protein